MILIDLGNDEIEYAGENPRYLNYQYPLHIYVSFHVRLLNSIEVSYLTENSFNQDPDDEVSKIHDWGPILLTWINFNPSIDKQLHPL